VARTGLGWAGGGAEDDVAVDEGVRASLGSDEGGVVEGELTLPVILVLIPVRGSFVGQASDEGSGGGEARGYARAGEAEPGDEGGGGDAGGADL